MATKLFKKDNKFKAKIVTENQKPCAFCHRKIDDELNYGKLYAIGDIQCHYFCALLSCCLVQNGPEEVGLFGFLYLDILAELERCKKHRCSFCGQGGANIGCCVSTCRKQFHLPCGRERDAVSLFYGNFKSFCRIHAPKQKIPEHIMSKAKIRMKQDKQIFKEPMKIGAVEKCGIGDILPEKSSEDMVCVICYEAVDGFPTLHTFWPPCCARDAWFHRTCLQRMALTAGMHYLKCPLCNDKDNFYDSVVAQGYYVPDRDAAWELEQNAFSEIYERPIICGADECLCPLGRKHDAENGPWDIKLCLLCGSVGRHAQCFTEMFVCDICEPVAPSNLDDLANKIDNIIQQEQSQSANNRRGPVMPSRMSLRRTKGRGTLLNRPSGSRTNVEQTESQNTLSSRLELNLKPPRKPSTNSKYDGVQKYSENDGLFSPNKVITVLQQKGVNLDEKLIAKIRRKILKPRPLSVKKRIVNETLNGLLKEKSPLKEPKQKDPVKEWLSPKKHDVDNVEEIQPPCHVSTPQKNSKTATPIKKSKTLQKSPKSCQKEPISENVELKSFQEEPILEDMKPENAQKDPIFEDKEPKSAQKDPNIDETSNSTFELPAEFVADVQSDDSCHFDTPKSKTIDIKHNSSVEIFEKDETVGIDVIKVENKNLFDKIFNFSPQSECKTKNMDLENFKKEYLNEVNIKSENLDSCPKLSTSEKEKSKLSSNCQSDVKKRGRKRCRSENIKTIGSKKRKTSENDLILHYHTNPVKNNKNEEKEKKSKLRKKKNKKHRSNKNLKLTFDSETKTKNKKSKLKTKFSINNKKIKLKIQWKKELLSFELQSNKKQKKIKTKKDKKLLKNESPHFKQYILQCPTEGTSKDVLIKPENEIQNIKMKKIKLEKTPDKFKQTSLHSFFKVKLPNE